MPTAGIACPLTADAALHLSGARACAGAPAAGAPAGAAPPRRRRAPARPAALREGARIETGRPVKAVLVGLDGAARGVRLAGGEEARRAPVLPMHISALS